jgi:hypothetical protein
VATSIGRYTVYKYTTVKKTSLQKWFVVRIKSARLYHTPFIYSGKHDGGKLEGRYT